MFAFKLDQQSAIPDVGSEDQMISFLKLQYGEAGERVLYVPLPTDFGKNGVHSLFRRDGMWWFSHQA